MNKRRKLLIALGAGALAAPFGSFAQQQGKVWRVGYLALSSGEEVAPTMVAFKERLRELGYIDGKNLLFEYRSAEDRQERLAELATELTRARPDVLIAGSGTLVPMALKKVTTTIPIVFTSVGDPVGAGVVASLARPGGNITGLSSLAAGIASKRLQLLQGFVPKSRSVAVLMNPATPFAMLALTEIRAAAEMLRIRLEILELKTGDQVANRFEAAIKAGAAGMIVVEDPLTYTIRQQVIDLAARYKLPTIYGRRETVEAGGEWHLHKAKRLM